MEQEQERALRAEIGRLERLQAFTAELSRAVTPSDVAEVAWRIGGSLMGATSGAFMLLSERGDALDLWGSFGMPDEVVGQFKSMPVEFSIPVAEAVRSGKPVFVSSKADRVRRYPHLADLHPSIDGGAWAGLPMVADRRILGAMGMNFATDRDFAEDEVRYLMTIASQCGQALARARIYETLRRSEERFETIFHTIPTAVLIVDPNGVILDCNQGFSAMTGWRIDEAIGRTTLELALWADPRLRQNMSAELARTGRVTNLAGRLTRKDGGTREVLGGAVATDLGGRKCVVAMLDDVGELRRLEAELRQSQKMEAIGRLAGGIAHDFNNILTAITGYADLLIDAVDVRASAQKIRRAADRASALTRQLLAFARKQTLQPVDIDLNEVVRGVADLLGRLIGEQIALRLELSPEACCVRADRGQLEQVVLNLVVNARDAMPRGGTLTLSTTCEGDVAILRVRDTGEGMTEEMRARIFEPFFTTKEPDRGTGLGLSTVYGIVRQSGGEIRVDSKVGQGAVFEVTLPRVDATRVQRPAPRPQPNLRGSETVLVCEDDAEVREFACRVLELNGYTVLPASSGMEAIQLAESHSSPIALLLSDVVMPQMHGQEVASRLRDLRPDMRVLLMSGYPGNGAVDPEVPYIEKPFGVQQLLAKVREVLD